MGDGDSNLLIMPDFPNIMIAGVPFTFEMEATNNPTSWAADHLPAGLALNAATGTISGTIAAPGVYSFQLTATNAAGSSAPMFVYLEVSAPEATGGEDAALVPVILVTPAYPFGNASDTGCIVLTAAVAGAEINNQFYASNEPTAWTANNLPAGLALAAGTGILSGTVAAAGNYIFEIIASNEAGNSVPVPVALSVTAAAVAAASGLQTGWLTSDLSLTDLQFDLRGRGVTSSYMVSGGGAAQGASLAFFQGDTCKLAILLLTPAQVNDATTIWFAACTDADSPPIISQSVAGSAALTAVTGGNYYLMTLDLDALPIGDALNALPDPGAGQPAVLSLVCQLAVLRNGQTARSAPFQITITERLADADPSDH